MPVLPEVAFDESGNSGQNLLDREQPIFALAGVLFSGEEVSEIRELLGWADDEELHFVRLRKSKEGRARILKLLGSSFATADHVKTMGIHKAFMVMTKIVDMLIEPVAYRDGVDLYEDGGHLATSNLMHITIPSRLGEEAYADLLQRFVAMMRSGRIREIR
ncbi:MAG TPA: hypothetical protein VJ837_04370, partial [Candidatus Paceibacterota bacterium]|nr:hypothetical protein [Candidatus Paceibacterota bacterium]